LDVIISLVSFFLARRPIQRFWFFQHLVISVLYGDWMVQIAPMFDVKYFWRGVQSRIPF
jgi:hypothetical protein